MPTITTCPSCNGPLRIPEELVGQRVRCPTCQTIFDAAPAPPPAPAPEPERPLWKNLRLELDKSDPAIPQSAPPRPEPPPVRRPANPPLKGAVEIELTGGEAPPSPPPPQRREPPPHPDSREYPPDDEDEDHPRRSPYDRGPRRRDTEPHRGALVLVLGIISLVCALPAFCTYGLFGLVGIPLGVTAWILGRRDLGKIKREEMDEEGLGITQAGWICGIIGTILNGLVLLTCGGFITFMILMESNRANFAPKPQFGAPVAPAPPAMNP